LITTMRWVRSPTEILERAGAVSKTPALHAQDR